MYMYMYMCSACVCVTCVYMCMHISMCVCVYQTQVERQRPQNFSIKESSWLRIGGTGYQYKEENCDGKHATVRDPLDEDKILPDNQKTCRGMPLSHYLMAEKHHPFHGFSFKVQGMCLCVCVRAHTHTHMHMPHILYLHVLY